MLSWQNLRRSVVWPRVLRFLGLNRSMVGALAMVVFVGLGERVAERFVPVYLLALGASSLVPGFLNGLTNLLSALYSYPAGWLSDRIGYKRSLAVFNGLAALGFAVVAVFPSWISVVVGSFFFLSWSALSLPATMSLVSAVLPKHKHTMGVSMHSLVRRIPMALGPLLGGALVDTLGLVTGVRIAFGVSFFLAILALGLQQFFILEASVSENKDAGEPFFNLVRNFSRPLKILLASDILIRFCEQIPYAYLALWVMEHPAGARLSGRDFGVLTFIEMMVALLVYVPVAWLSERVSKKSLVVITFFNFTMFPLAFYFSRSFAWLVVAFVVRGLKEFGEPTRKALILDLSAERQKASAFGAYYLIRDVVVSLAAFLSGYLWQHSPGWSFGVATVFGILGTLLFFVWGSDVGIQPRESHS